MNILFIHQNFPGQYKYLAPALHPWAAEFETKVIRAKGAARACLKLKERGFTPDIICVHPGWGESLLLKDVFFDAKIISFHEFYYHPRGVDVGFDPEFNENSFEYYAKVRLKNAHLLLSYENSDKIITPTHWQKMVAPKWAQEKMEVVFMLENKESLQDIRKNARETIVSKYDLKRVCLPKQIEIVEEMGRQ